MSHFATSRDSHCMRARIHRHAYSHPAHPTHSHTHPTITHTHARAHAHAYAHTRKHTHIHTHTHTHTPSCQGQGHEATPSRPLRPWCTGNACRSLEQMPKVRVWLGSCHVASRRHSTSRQSQPKWTGCALSPRGTNTFWPAFGVGRS